MTRSTDGSNGRSCLPRAPFGHALSATQSRCDSLRKASPSSVSPKRHVCAASIRNRDDQELVIMRAYASPQRGHCASCEGELTGPSIYWMDEVYCCRGCALGDPCVCN